MTLWILLEILIDCTPKRRNTNNLSGSPRRDSKKGAEEDLLMNVTYLLWYITTCFACNTTHYDKSNGNVLIQMVAVHAGIVLELKTRVWNDNEKSIKRYVLNVKKNVPKGITYLSKFEIRTVSANPM